MTRRITRGFTLIELMVAISITAVLGTLGIAGFTNYNQAQVLQTSANEVVTMLNLAKSRAQSQIKPSDICPDGGSGLSGYVVRITSPSRYWMYVTCNNLGIKVDGEQKSLPSGLSFAKTVVFVFPVQTGRAQALDPSVSPPPSGSSSLDPPQIVISDSGGKTKTITVNALGGISVK